MAVVESTATIFRLLNADGLPTQGPYTIREGDRAGIIDTKVTYLWENDAWRETGTAMPESQVAFDTSSGHDHDGTDSKKLEVFWSANNFINEYSSTVYQIRDSADSMWNDLLLDTLWFTAIVGATDAALIVPNFAQDDCFVRFGAGINDQTNWVEIGTLQGAAQPYWMIGRDDTTVTTNAIIDGLRLRMAPGTNNSAAGQGFGLPIYLGNDASETEERARIDFYLISAADGAETTAIALRVLSGATPVTALLLTPTYIETVLDFYIRTQHELRFYDNGNYVGFEAGALGADQIWVLPTADGGAGDYIKTDGGGNLSWDTPAGGGDVTAAAVITDHSIVRGDGGGKGVQDSGIIISDTDVLTLAGMLDMGGQAIGDGTLELITFTETAAAINHIHITNADIGNYPSLSAVGDDTNVHLHIAPKGTGHINIDRVLPSTAAQELEGLQMVVDSSAQVSTSIFHGIEIETTGTPAGEVAALATIGKVKPVHQHTATPVTPSQTEFAGLKSGGGVTWADGLDATEIFVADDDSIFVGAAAQFDEIEVIMTTGATKNVIPTFWYNTAADAWTEFFPSDGTEGFTISGNVSWSVAEITATWTGDGDPGGADTTAGYWIKIVRTRVSDPGAPTPSTIKIGASTEYEWDENADLSIRGLTVAGDFNLGENAIVLDTAISADGQYSGITEAGTAGAALAFGDLVYYAVADSRWELADADAEATAFGKLGICVLAAVGDGSATTVLLWGKVNAATAFPALTVGAPVFVGTTAGDVVTTAPSGAADIIRIVGYGNTADELYFCPDNTFIEHV